MAANGSGGPRTDPHWSATLPSARYTRATHRFSAHHWLPGYGEGPPNVSPPARNRLETRTPISLGAKLATRYLGGWLSTPLPIDTIGNGATYQKGKTNIAFRFDVDLADKVRARDDHRRNTANIHLHCTVWAPIKLPTRDHISHMSLNIRHTQRKWAFSKSDHEAAYKQLPTTPDHTNLALVALKSPTAGRRMASPPRALLFGAESSVLHYDCFPRLISAIFNNIFGIPLMVEFEDCGALIPKNRAGRALRTIVQFCEILGIRLKLKKTEPDARIAFLGLQGTAPQATNDMLLTIKLHKEKAARWATDIARYVDSGSISHRDIESAIGGRRSPRRPSPAGSADPCPRPSTPNYIRVITTIGSRAKNQRLFDGGSWRSPK